MDEATAFLSTLQNTAPTAPTACAGWTAHQLVAHLTAGAAEMAGLTEAVTSGRGEGATTDFAAREAPYVAMADDELRTRLVVEAIRLSSAIEELDTASTGLTVPFAGRRLDSGALTMHGRSEAALHRWDLAGDDDLSQELLSQPALTVHAVKVLNTMLDASAEAVAKRAAAAGITTLRATFAAPGHPDVVLVVDGARARLDLGECPTPWCATADPATRLLALWGRRSGGRRVIWNAEEPAAHPLALFLWGSGAGNAPSDTPIGADA
ncbi:MAG TPA: maleylpyruvate isomerase N-terminal domain-containing protein [Acidimicrobiales bacterium]